MNGKDLINGMGEIPEELLETKYEKPARRFAPSLRWAAIAAALLLVFGSVTAGAIAASRGKFAPLTDGTHGYSAEFGLVKIKWSKFKGDIRQTPEIIAEQYATFTPPPLWSSAAHTPGIFARSFDSQQEAAKYVGLKELKTPYYPYEEAAWSVGVTGDAEGKISEVTIYGRAVLTDENGMGAFASVNILTEHSKKDTASAGGDWGDYDPGSIKYEEFSTAAGRLCQYAKVGVPNMAYQTVTGYIVDNGILYSLHLNFRSGGLDRAMEELHRWAESFDQPA